MAAVVGLARTATYNFLNEAPLPFVYLPHRQHYRGAMTFVIHTAVPPSSVAAAVRAEVRAVDPDVALYDVRSMREHLLNGRALFFVTLGATIAVAFGLLALALSTVGIYGVVSYGVSQRTREIGIRVALGARSARVVRMVVAQGLVVAALGIVLGLVAAAGVVRVLGSLLYGVAPSDPVVWVTVASLLMAIAVAASLLPAMRAARVDPMLALRSE
jgi:predicted lysophospholipase L1 biosynthesis ABC-type transport system permease subunit